MGFCHVAKDLRSKYHSAKAKGKMKGYRRLLNEDKAKNCRSAAQKKRDRCQALDILTKALYDRAGGGKRHKSKHHTPKHRGGGKKAPGSRYEKALQQVVDHYCKGGKKFCHVAKDLRSKYHSAKAKGKMKGYRQLLNEDKAKNCRSAAQKKRDRCQALDILTKALHDGSGTPSAPAAHAPAHPQSGKKGKKGSHIEVS